MSGTIPPHDAPAGAHGVAANVRAAIARDGFDWIVPTWPAPSAIGALSTTRAGGGAAALASSTSSAVAAQLPSAPVWLRQVHGADVIVLDNANVDDARRAPLHADAAVTRAHGIVCAVRTADCLPVLFAARDGSVVGAAHAGWRGLAAGVLEATIAALVAQRARREDLVAWLGPAIGPTAFEVGADVVDAFAATDPGSGACFVAQRDGKWLADLYALARRRLVAAGVGDVTGGDRCTVREPARFYSHRRAREAGRMATLVWIAPAGRDSTTI